MVVMDEPFMSVTATTLEPLESELKTMRSLLAPIVFRPSYSPWVICRASSYLPVESQRLECGTCWTVTTAEPSAVMPRLICPYQFRSRVMREISASG